MSEQVVTEAEARERLPELVDLAMAGEGVRITRNGAVVAELKTVAPRDAAQLAGKLMTPGEWEWLRANRVGDRRLVKEDAGALVRRMRDEGL